MIETRGESKIKPELSPIEASSRLLTYLKTTEVLRSLADTYVDHQAQRRVSHDSNRSNRVERAFTALSDLLEASEDPVSLHKFQRDWGEEAYLFEHYLKTAKPTLEEAHDRAREEAQDLSRIGRTILALRAARNATNHGASVEMQNVLSAVGYSKNDIAVIARSLTTSLGLTATTTYGVNTLMATALAWGATHHVFPELPDKNAILAVAFSYFIQYLAVYINATVNVSALKDPNIQTSPNILATTAYFLLKKLVPNNEKFQEFGVIAGSFLPAVFGEFVASAPIVLPNGSTIIVAKNIASTLGQLATAAGVKFWQRYKEASYGHK